MISGGNASSLPLVGGLPEPTIKELSKPGRRAFNYPKLDIDEEAIEHECLKKKTRADEEIRVLRSFVEAGLAFQNYYCNRD